MVSPFCNPSSRSPWTSRFALARSWPALCSRPSGSTSARWSGSRCATCQNERSATAEVEQVLFGLATRPRSRERVPIPSSRSVGGASTVRAAILPGLNEELQIRDGVEAIGPGPGEVRVRIAASGVCHSDVSLQDGTLPHPLPAVPGHEGAGEVLAVGDGVTGVAPGDHVIISWVPCCGRCTFCLGGQPNLCNAFLERNISKPMFMSEGAPLFGYAGTGTFAEETVVAQEAAIKIDPDVACDVAEVMVGVVEAGACDALNT